MTTETALVEDASSSHRIYIGDSIGCLRIAQCAPPSVLPDDYAGPSVKSLILPNFKSHSDHAVQRLATGVLADRVYVVAMARKNATIDIVQIVNQALPTWHSSSSKTTAEASELKANILCTIHEDRMRAGIQRFIGLAVGSQGVYSVTSSGVFRFSPITISGSGEEVTATVGEPKVLDTLPSPLQHASFYPASNPTHFCYGGEDIPLSLWHIDTAVSEQPEALADMSVDSIKTTEDLSGLNSKQRKRKRQLEAKSKARELLWGEVWRAKNLPNDNLSLPRRANITSTCVLSLTQGEGDEAGSVGEASYIAVGTKDGLVRIFQPSGLSRRHIREIRVVPTCQGAVKTLCASTDALDSQKGGLLFVGDTGSKLYAVDWQTGAVLYGYKGMAQVGATLSMATLPRSAKSGEPEALATVSSDSLVRLHTTVPAALAVPKPGTSPDKGEVKWSKMIVSASSQSVYASPTAVVWDGVLPSGLDNWKVKVVNEDGEEEVVDEDQDQEEVDEVWAKMEAVGAKKGKMNGRQVGKAQGEGDSEDDEDEDEDEEEEEKTTQKNGNGKRKGKPAQPKKSRK